MKSFVFRSLAVSYLPSFFTTNMDKKETKSDEDKDFAFEIEPVLNYIGPKSRWQYFQSFCLFLFGASAGMSVVSFAFPGYIPNYRHSLFRGVLIQSWSAGTKKFTNYAFCHPQFSGVIQNIENCCVIRAKF